MKKNKSKKIIKNYPRKKKMTGELKTGAMFVISILIIAVAGGSFAVGGVAPLMDPIRAIPTPGPGYTCCDTGNGDACEPILDKQITYNGETYALLKSNIAAENHAHLAPTDQYTEDGRRIFINNSSITSHYPTSKYPACKPGMDLVGIYNPLKEDDEKKVKFNCTGIPDDMLVYVCNGSPEVCAMQQTPKDIFIPFDAYYRLKDGPVPEVLKTSCARPVGAEEAKSQDQQIIGIPTPGGRNNLQLEWFQVQNNTPPYRWFVGWCKPAIYLYPEQKSEVNVQVYPKGEFTLTIPQYPENGWTVTAHPNGEIGYQGETYPYLYWEASLSDKIIPVPTEGYSVPSYRLGELFYTVLPQMGLNAKETKEFSEYWLKALPKSPYYFVGVLTQSEIDSLAPLAITPKPDSVLRVSLYFKAMDEHMPVPAPHLSGFDRDGFTVTEWGGIFKASKSHPGFSCVM